jgi:hypothetical protein
MELPELIKSQVTRYLILAAELKARFVAIDDETLADTLEGATELTEAIGAVVRSSLEDAALIEALKGRLQNLELRLVRFRDRYDKKRALARWAMLEAGLDKVLAADFSVGLRKGMERLEVRDESEIASDYFVEQPPKLDRKSLLDALKRGEKVGGAALVMSEISLQVRVL